MAVKAKAAADDTPLRITAKSGVWFDMAPMTARDFLTIAGMKKGVGASEVVDVLSLMEKRVVASSVADPLDRPLTEILEVLQLWLGRKETLALPPASATS